MHLSFGMVRDVTSCESSLCTAVTLLPVSKFFSSLNSPTQSRPREFRLQFFSDFVARIFVKKSARHHLMSLCLCYFYWASNLG